MDVHYDGKRAGYGGSRDEEIQLLRVAIDQVPMGSAQPERNVGGCRGAPTYQPCQEQRGSKKKKPSDHPETFSGLLSGITRAVCHSV
jgi:hypothetical protein